MSHRTIQTDDGCTSDPEKWLPRLHVYENRSLIELEGNFISENPLVVQEQVLKVLSSVPYNKYTFVFKLEKFNTAAFHICYNIMAHFEKYFEAKIKSKEVRVEWHYDEENEIMKEEGQDFYDIFIMPIFLVSHT